jgi:RecB family endonuclease NucS
LNTSFIWRENKLANLLWKTPRGTKSLLVTPFTTEEDFEKTVFDAQDILEDIFFLKRQVRGGNKPGIPDIVGIDSDGNVCIVEMKNVTVDSSHYPSGSTVCILG